jgi:hypothetical protein
VALSAYARPGPFGRGGSRSRLEVGFLQVRQKSREVYQESERSGWSEECAGGSIRGVRRGSIGASESVRGVRGGGISGVPRSVWQGRGSRARRSAQGAAGEGQREWSVRRAARGQQRRAAAVVPVGATGGRGGWRGEPGGAVWGGRGDLGWRGRGRSPGRCRAAAAAGAREPRLPGAWSRRWWRGASTGTGADASSAAHSGVTEAR